MSFLKKLFGKSEEPKANSPKETLPWIEASDNPWGIRLLDLRPISQSMLSSSSDPQMATNAISYGGQDGTSFWGLKPQNPRTISSSLVFPIDETLAPGVLFIPDTMEHKWVIYFDGEHLIFIRSWLRQVMVIAKTSQRNHQLHIESITGEFTEGESEAFTKACLHFLLVSHCLEAVVPAPLKMDCNSEAVSQDLRT